MCQQGVGDCDGDVCTVDDVCTSNVCVPGPRLDNAGLSAWLRNAVNVPECAGIKRAGRVAGKLRAARKAVDRAQDAPAGKRHKKLAAASNRIEEGQQIADRARKKLGPVCHQILVGHLSGARSRMDCLR